ncbi:MAG: dihydroorotase [Rikenellaceae bacterium]|jgi:dihydroorotase|nr:dihydroorotase [Rikenellaceae bacterium]
MLITGHIVNEGRAYDGWVLVRGGRIEAVGEGAYTGPAESERIDAPGCYVIPGVIDDQVHFREPGLTAKGDIASESRAAIVGGVTSYMEMPNTKPPSTSMDEWERKNEIAARTSYANYAFYFGATNENIKEIARLDPRRVCGVKVFMGSSTGNMLVDNEKALAAIFAESPVLVATHCESEPLVKAAAERIKTQYGDNPPASVHPLVRDAEACYRSTAEAVELAVRYGTDLHVLHLSSARELALFESKPLADKKITNEVCLHHLWFTDADYATKGNLIKWNPAIKSIADRDALRMGVFTGRVDVVATDHAPHLLEEKLQPYRQAPSGGPLVQHSLVGMLELFDPAKVVEKMCHAPAVRYNVKERGFLRPGYHADIAIVDPASPWTVGRENILYKCAWSPFEGVTFHHRVAQTLLGGRTVYRCAPGETGPGQVDPTPRGTALEFKR